MLLLSKGKQINIPRMLKKLRGSERGQMDSTRPLGGLNYDESFQVWLTADYDDIRTLCAIVRASDELNLIIFKDICNDPQSWITRAYVKLKVKPEQFWNRSVVESVLELPGETEGKRAQMRYVELVSRRGVCYDSFYFLHPYEVARRAMFQRKQELFEMALIRAKQGPQPDDLFFRLVTEELVEFSTLLGTKQGRMNFLQYFPDGISTIEEQRNFIRGLQGIISTPVTLSNIRGLIASRRWDRAMEAINIYPPILGNNWNRNNTPASFLSVLFSSNNVTFISDVLERYPDLMGFLGGGWGVINVDAIKSVEVLALARRNYLKSSLLNTGALYRGNIDVLNRVTLVHDSIFADVNEIVSAITGPYGLLALEWLTNNSIYIPNFRIGPTDIFMSRAAEMYYNEHGLSYGRLKITSVDEENI